MKPASFGEHQTRLIGAPAGWNPATDGECGALSVLDLNDGQGHNRMLSRWVLEPGDLAKLADGAPIYLSVLGITHPVVSVYLGEVEPERAATERASLSAGCIALVADDDAKPKGTLKELRQTAIMLERWGPECAPALPNGQVPFVRALMDSAAEEIRAFLRRRRKAAGKRAA